MDAFRLGMKLAVASGGKSAFDANNADGYANGMYDPAGTERLRNLRWMGSQPGQMTPGVQTPWKLLTMARDGVSRIPGGTKAVAAMRPAMDAAARAASYPSLRVQMAQPVPADDKAAPSGFGFPSRETARAWSGPSAGPRAAALAAADAGQAALRGNLDRRNQQPGLSDNRWRNQELWNTPKYRGVRATADSASTPAAPSASKSGAFVFGEKTAAKETRRYEVSGRSEVLDAMDRLLAWAMGCGETGHSGTAKFHVDGDGSGRIRVKGIKDPEASGEWLKARVSDGDPEISISLV